MLHFYELFFDACKATGISLLDLSPMGTNWHATETRRAEPDHGFKPCNTRSGMNDMATMVIEVGLSNTLSQLRTKAHAWLTAFDDKVKIVILLHIDPSARKITIERWEMVSRVLPRATSSRRPGKEQRIDITVDANFAATVRGTALYVDVDLLFDTRPPHISPMFIMVDTARLAAFASGLLRCLQ